MDISFTYFKPRTNSLAFAGTFIQVILMTASVIIFGTYGSGRDDEWIYWVAGFVMAFIIFSFTDNVLQLLVGIKHTVEIKKGILTIKNEKTGELLIEEKVGQVGVSTKAIQVRGGTVKHINIKHKDFEFSMIDNWVKSSDKDMQDFLKWHKKIGG